MVYAVYLCQIFYHPNLVGRDFFQTRNKDNRFMYVYSKKAAAYN